MSGAADITGIEGGVWLDAGAPPAGRRGIPLRGAGLAALFALLGVLFVWPLVMLTAGAFRTEAPGLPGAWTLSAFPAALAAPGVGRAILNSIGLTFATTGVATILAAFFAYLSERTDAPLRRWITPTMMVMFATPGLFYAVGYGQLANSYTGYLNKLAQVLLGLQGAPFNVESWPGLALVIAFRKVSVFYLFLLGPVRALNAAFEEASLVAGRGRGATFFRVTLPVLAPAIGGVVLLGLASGLHAFDIPLVLGQPAKIEVISLKIYAFLTDATPPDYARASALAVVLVAMVLVLFAIQRRVVGSRSYVTVSGKSAGVGRTALRSARPLAAGLIVLWLLAAAALPLTALILSSLQPYPGDYSSLTLSHYRDVLVRPETGQAFRATAILAVLVGGASMVLALTVVEASRRLGAGLSFVLRLILVIPLALPGLVTALAVVWAYVSIPGLRQVYGTLWLMVLAFIVVSMPLAMQQASAASAQIGGELREAARISGASGRRAFADVIAPLVAPSFLAGWYVAAVMVAGNIDVPLLLGAPGLTTVAAQIYDLNGLGRSSEAAALLVVMLIVTAAVGGLGVLLLRFAGLARRRLSEAS